MSSRCRFKKFFRHFLQKSVVVAVAKNIGNAKRNALRSKKMVLSLQIYICVQMFTNICSTAAMWFTSKNLEKYTLFLTDAEKIWFLNQTLKNFQKKSSSESFFRQRRFRRGVKKTIGIAERNAMRLNIMYYVLNRSHDFIKRVINDAIKTR